MKKHAGIILLAGVNLIILIGAVFVIPMLPNLLLYWGFGAEEMVMQNTIRNPYVNDRYTGWEQIDSEEYGRFRLPQNWTFSEEDNLCRILDEEGNTWAVGIWQGDCPDRTTFLQTVFSEDGSFAECTYEQESVYMNGCSVGCVGMDGLDSAPIYFLELRKEYGRNLFLLILDCESTGNDTYRVAEAIAYAYAYKQ